MQTAPCTPNSEKTAFLGYNSEDFSIKSQSGSIDKTKPQISLSEGMALIVCHEWNSEVLCHPWGVGWGAGQGGSRVAPGAAACAPWFSAPSRAACTRLQEPSGSAPGIQDTQELAGFPTELQTRCLEFAMACQQQH